MNIEIRVADSGDAQAIVRLGYQNIKAQYTFH
jgi:hypothetical protein